MRIPTSQLCVYPVHEELGYPRGMTLGQRIKQLREQAGLTQEQLGQRFYTEKKNGMGKQAISHWENDRNQPTASQLILLCSIFNVSADALLGTDKGAPTDLNDVSELVRLYAGMDSKARARVLDVARFEGSSARNAAAANHK